MAEMAAALMKLEGEKIEVVSDGDRVISDAALEVLLDRRPEVFSGRGVGWKSGADNDSGKTAFGVYEGRSADEADGMLAGLMGEE